MNAMIVENRSEFWRFSSRNKLGHIQHPQTLGRRNLVLDLWAAGNTIDAISFIAHLEADTVSKHLRAARKAGDARAVVRHTATLHAMEIAGVENSGREVAEPHGLEGMDLRK